MHAHQPNVPARRVIAAALLFLCVAAPDAPRARAADERRPAPPPQHRRHPGRRHGLLRHRLLRRRDPHAQPRRPRRRRAALHAVLQHRPLLPDAGRACSPGLYPHQAGVGHMMDDREPDPRDGYRGDLNDALRHHRRGAQAGRLPHLRGRQVARHPARPPRTARSTTGRCSAASTATTARSSAAGSFFDPATLVPRQHADQPVRRPGVPAAAGSRTTTPTRSATTPCRFIGEHDQRPRRRSRSSCTSPSPPPTGRCTPCRRTSPSTRASTTPATSRSARPASRRSKKLGLIDPAWDLSPQAGDWDEGGGQGVGGARAWRSTRRWSTAWTRASAGSSPSCKRTGQLDNTLILFLQDNGGNCRAASAATGNKEHPTPRPTSPTLAADCRPTSSRRQMRPEADARRLPGARGAAA